MMKIVTRLVIATLVSSLLLALSLGQIADARTVCRSVVTYEQQCQYAYTCGYAGCAYVYQCQIVPVTRQVCEEVREQVCERVTVERCDSAGCRFVQEYQCRYE